MSRAPEIKSINCTACGAGLEILGGGRVTSHICTYCGTELDAVDNYKALQKFANLRRPNSPFEIGMSGQLQGVEFTIIGTLAYRESYGGQIWEWVDHQVFSATHGYAYVTVEDGHLIFTRKYRKPTTPDWLSSDYVERAEHRPIVRSNYERFEYYDTSTSEITFAEGEFNWRPKVGEKGTTVSVLSDESMLGFSVTSTEREVERSTYLPQAETYASFGITDFPAARGVHALQPFKAGKHQNFLTGAGLFFAAICLGLTLFMAAQGSLVLSPTTFNLTSLPAEVTFEIKEPGKLTKVEFSGNVDNSWAWIEMTLSDPEDQPLFEAGREIDAYSGFEGGESWSEGNRRASLTFHPETAGIYTIEMEVTEADTWQRGGAALSKISVQVSAGLSSVAWIGALMLAFLGLSGFQIGRRVIHHNRRRAGSDWVDEDDD